MKKTSNKTQNLLAAGVGVAALAAGAYFFFGPEGKRHRTKMKGWMIRMKGEVIEQLENAKEVTEPIYHEIVDAVAAAYAEAGKIPAEEVAVVAGDLKRHWKQISKSLKSDAKVAVKKGVKKVKNKIAKLG